MFSGAQSRSRALSKAMPSDRRPSISITWVTAWTAQGSRALEVERAAAGVLGAAVVVHLLEAEGVHAEHVAVAGHVAVPIGQHARDAVAQHHGLAEEEVALMPELQGQQVARVVDHDRAEEVGGALQVALEPGAQRGHVPALALVRGRREMLRGLDAAAQFGLGAALGRSHHQAGAEAVAEDETGVRLQHPVDRRERVGEIAVEQLQRPLEPVERRLIVRRNRHAPAVLQSHCVVPLHPPGNGRGR